MEISVDEIQPFAKHAAAPHAPMLTHLRPNKQSFAIAGTWINEMTADQNAFAAAAATATWLAESDVVAIDATVESVRAYAKLRVYQTSPSNSTEKLYWDAGDAGKFASDVIWSSVNADAQFTASLASRYLWSDFAPDLIAKFWRNRRAAVPPTRGATYGQNAMKLVLRAVPLRKKPTSLTQWFPRIWEESSGAVNGLDRGAACNALMRVDAVARALPQTDRHSATSQYAGRREASF